MACPDGTIAACDFPQFLVDQTPRFDELIIEDIRPTDGWIGNITMGQMPMGTPAEVTMDRFRSVWANTTKPWSRVQNAGAGCSGNPCDPTSNQIGWGADRLTYYAEQATWETPLLCYDQEMHVTHAEQHLAQIINEILRPNTSNIFAMFARKRALLWAKYRHMANSLLSSFSFQWNQDADGNESYFDTSASPSSLYHLVPQMLQNNFSKSMREGYAGKNPFKETSPFIELVTDMDTCWFLDKLGANGSTLPGGNTATPAANWRFTEWSAANAFWRYGFSGQIGNYLTRVDELGLRFNYVADLGAGANGGNGNRYRYQIVLPFENGVTTGSGGAAGIGSNVNPDFDAAHFAVSFQWHKQAIEMLVADATPINPEMPFMSRDFGGKWRFLMNNLGADVNGVAINNKWGNKGQFAAWFKYYVRPLHYEFARVYFHKREQFCIPEIDTCSTDPGYPAQNYSSTLPECPAPDGEYGTGVPTGDEDGPIAPPA